MGWREGGRRFSLRAKSRISGLCRSSGAHASAQVELTLLRHDWGMIMHGLLPSLDGGDNFFSENESDFGFKNCPNL